MGDKLQVDPKVLKQAADGINSITGELGKLGIGATASVGRGFALLTLSSMEAGKQTVQTSFEDFCERWSWGVRSLVQAANGIAATLDLSAGRYHQMEQIASNTFKKMWTDIIGNPQLSKEDAGKRSWSATFSDNWANHVMHPDYSRKSFEQMQNSGRTNLKVIQAVGPKALANIGVVGLPQFVGPAALAGGPTPGWNTGEAQRAAKIMQDANTQQPVQQPAGGE
ncbi:hypothetical protein [Nocardia altamirensis]|uniref:hypothetical protein n=1 Tax=Nocardia altamirensis TaxID=472158 RepID=UPI00084028F4|nr:hypothetical protein [Nocardia altamirensis]